MHGSRSTGLMTAGLAASALAVAVYALRESPDPHAGGAVVAGDGTDDGDAGHAPRAGRPECSLPVVFVVVLVAVTGGRSRPRVLRRLRRGEHHRGRDRALVADRLRGRPSRAPLVDGLLPLAGRDQPRRLGRRRGHGRHHRDERCARPVATDAVDRRHPRGRTGRAAAAVPAPVAAQGPAASARGDGPPGPARPRRPRVRRRRPVATGRVPAAAAADVGGGAVHQPLGEPRAAGRDARSRRPHHDRPRPVQGHHRSGLGHRHRRQRAELRRRSAPSPRSRSRWR